MYIDWNVNMVQKVIGIASQKNPSCNRVVMPRDHDHHRPGVLLVFKQPQVG